MEERNHKAWTCQQDGDGGTVTPGMIFGLAIVAVGVLFLLDNFGVNVGMIWRYWPVVLVAIGLAKLVDASDSAGRTGGAILMIVGFIFLADRIHLPFFENLSLWSLWPVALIAVGVIMLVGALDSQGGGKRWGSRLWGSVSTGYVAHANLVAIFSGGKRRIVGDFKGGDMLALFGGYTLDLRAATMSADEAVLNANAIFGGFDIKVPDTWSVVMQVTGIFGGHDDKTHQPDPRLVPNPKRLIVRGATIFGGLDVKN